MSYFRGIRNIIFLIKMDIILSKTKVLIMDKKNLKKAIIKSADNERIEGKTRTIKDVVTFQIERDKRFENATEFEKKLEIKKRVKIIKKSRSKKLRGNEIDSELLKEYSSDIDSNKIMKKARKYVDKNFSLLSGKDKSRAILNRAKTLRKKELNKIKKTNNESIDKEGQQYHEKLLKELSKRNVVNELLDYHLKKNDINKTATLQLILKYIEIEDEHKKLSLNEKQYKEWLAISGNHYITTSQCEVLFGLSKKQQQGLRTKRRDSLEYVKLDKKSILYEREYLEKYLENYISKAR